MELTVKKKLYTVVACLVAALLLGLWLNERAKNNDLREIIEKDRQITEQKIIDIINHDLSDLTNNFELYRKFGKTVLDSTKWYISNVAPLITDYAGYVEDSMTVLSFVLPFIPGIGPVLGKVTEEVASITSEAINYTNKFNELIKTMDRTNKTMDKIQKLNDLFAKNRDKKVLSDLKKVLSLDFQQNFEDLSKASLEVQIAIKSAEEFLADISLATAKVSKQLLEYEAKYSRSDRIPEEEGVFATLKSAVDKNLVQINSSVISKTRNTMDDLNAKVDAVLAVIGEKANPLKNQIFEYSEKIKLDFKRITRISAGVQVIELLEKKDGAK
jgi:hypothetical protein